MNRQATITLLAALGLLVGSAGAAIVTDSLAYEFIADSDDGADGQWNDLVAGGSDPYFEAGSLDHVSIGPTLTLYSNAFRYDGSDTSRLKDGGSDLKSGPALSDNSNFTLEVWLRPAALGSGASDFNQTIIDFGGNGNGSGIYLSYNAATGETTVGGYADGDDAAVSASSASLIVGDIADLMQVVLSVTPTEANLYVNTTAYAAGAPGTGASGNNPVGLGSTEGQAGGSNGAFVGDNLVGDIAAARIYDGKALTAAEVSQNYQTVIPEPASMALLGLGGLAVLRRRRR